MVHLIHVRKAQLYEHGAVIWNNDVAFDKFNSLLCKRDCGNVTRLMVDQPKRNSETNYPANI